MLPFIGLAQEATMAVSVDTTQIRIGEQIQYSFTVEADTTDLVHFPEGQTFSPLEMVEAFTTDTVKANGRMTLEKVYALTQFDSGAYTIPPQRIQINEKAFMTDSFRIAVGTVAVDTTTQKMYDIKGLQEVSKGPWRIWGLPWYIFFGIVLAVLAALAFGIYYFFFRKKQLTEAEKEALLPPYDRALLELKRLENSRYIIQDEYKKYYSELTDIVRSYLEEEVNVSAMESTTDELITKLEMMADAGSLDLENDTIKQFKQVLQTADLVKFAKRKPESSVAEQDRKHIEHIVVKTKEAIPEPTEEELQQTEAYLAELAAKRRRNYWIYAGVAGLFLILAGLGIAMAKYGATYVKDTILGHHTKELLEEKDWVSSSYGFPPVHISTPKVLVRQKVELPAEAKAAILDVNAFMYRSSVGLFTVGVISNTYKAETEPDFQGAIEGLLAELESKGAKNITTKQDEFTTQAGVTGAKCYGSGKFAVPESDELIRGKYAVYLFGGKGFLQQVMITWLDGDEYAEEIAKRIEGSIDVKTE
nr:BatD family protein [Sediminicola luteus]